jgi:dTDP-4-dehydrorhamnose 3,5-epimerase
MRVLETRLDGPKLLAPAVFGDARGFFTETFRASTLAGLGIEHDWIQDNQSRSRRGVVRGMHFQIGAGTAKLVRCARGRIFDVVADLRRGSPTYLEWEGFELDDVAQHVLYVPVGFAHGFCVLSEDADVVYKQTGYYSPDVERGVRYDDPDLGIVWPPGLELQPSERDATAPRVADVADELPFTYEGP